MFARFTEQARGSMALAQDEAARLGHPWLGTEHLLLGLLRQPATAASSVLEDLGVTREAAERELADVLGGWSDEQILGEDDERALRTLGIDLHEVRARIEETFGRGALDRAIPGRCGVPMMPRLKQALERAAKEAGRGPIETDHLLLGVIHVRGAFAVEILNALGLTPDVVRARVMARRSQAS
jgi:ATP-dependent Clp protease ATP-binding subunit ClpA